MTGHTMKMRECQSEGEENVTASFAFACFQRIDDRVCLDYHIWESVFSDLEWGGDIEDMTNETMSAMSMEKSFSSYIRWYSKIEISPYGSSHTQTASQREPMEVESPTVCCSYWKAPTSLLFKRRWVILSALHLPSFCLDYRTRSRCKTRWTVLTLSVCTCLGEARIIPWPSPSHRNIVQSIVHRSTGEWWETEEIWIDEWNRFFSPSEEYLQTASRKLTVDELHQHAQDARSLYHEFWVGVNDLRKKHGDSTLLEST